MWCWLRLFLVLVVDVVDVVVAVVWVLVFIGVVLLVVAHIALQFWRVVVVSVGGRNKTWGAAAGCRQLW